MFYFPVIAAAVDVTAADGEGCDPSYDYNS